MAGIYAHWPFCARKCAYCAFVSGPDLSGMDAYLKALIQEARLRAEEAEGRRFGSVFFGGGTPSTAPAYAIPQVLDALRERCCLEPDAEISVEANPSSLSEEKLDAWLAAGAGRLSMGLQAAQDRHLATLGRLHSREGFAKAFRLARRAGFANLSVDLMYGLPDQSMAEWEETLEWALSLGPEHVSGYCLSLEEGTPLLAMVEEGTVPEPDEDLAADMYIRMHEVLERAGYVHYEISNFALPGWECRHNLKYWTREEYLGLGCAAHSLMDGVRHANTEDVAGYVAALGAGRDPRVSSERVDRDGAEEEMLLLGTRLRDGVSLDEYAELAGAPLTEARGEGLRRSIQEGLCEIRGGRLRPTLRGFLFQNRLALNLVS